MYNPRQSVIIASRQNIAIAVAALLISVNVPAVIANARPMNGGRTSQSQKHTQNRMSQAKQRQAELAQPQRRSIPLLPAADVTGRRVTDPKGHDAGRVNSMVLDTKNGTVEYVIIGGRGHFNLNGQLVAVPWPEIQWSRGHGDIGIRIAARQLANAPRISRRVIYQLVTRNGRARIYGYYGRPYPYYGTPGWYWPYRRPYRLGGIATAPASPPNGTTGMNATAPNNAQSSSQSAGRIAVRGRQARQQAAEKAQASAQNDQQETTAEPTNNLAVNQNGVVSMLMKSGTVSPQQLRAANIYDNNDKFMGQVDEVLIDTRSGHIAYVLVKRGGFLGLNPTWFAVPPEALHWSLRDAGYGYRLTVSGRKLLSVPPVPANRAHLTTFVPRQQLAKLYRHFGVKLYWTGQDAAQRINRGNNDNGTTGRNADESSR